MVNRAELKVRAELTGLGVRVERKVRAPRGVRAPREVRAELTERENKVDTAEKLL